MLSVSMGLFSREWYLVSQRDPLIYLLVFLELKDENFKLSQQIEAAWSLWKSVEPLIRCHISISPDQAWLNLLAKFNYFLKKEAITHEAVDPGRLGSVWENPALPNQSCTNLWKNSLWFHLWFSTNIKLSLQFSVWLLAVAWLKNELQRIICIWCYSFL